MKVKKSLLKFISPETDHASRLKTARGETAEFRALSAEDQITLLFILSHDSDLELAIAASASLDSAPSALILAALTQRLNLFVLRDLFVRFRSSGPILSAIASNAGIDGQLACAIAQEAPVKVLNAFESNPALPGILTAITEGLGKNPLADDALVERLKAAAKGRPKTQEKAGAKSVNNEEGLDDLISQEKGFDSDRFNVYQALCSMTAGEKIKLAHTGDRSVRNLLIKDKNRVVALSVLKNPKLTEQEVVMIVSSTSVSEDIIREVANSRQWMKSYNVKTAMAFNPHTPLSFSLKIIDYLRERELKQLAKNKGVPGALANAAKRKLKLRKR